MMDEHLDASITLVCEEEIQFFIKNHGIGQIKDALESKELEAVYPVVLSLTNMANSVPVFTSNLFERPALLLAMGNKMLLRVMRMLYDDTGNVTDKWTLKTKLRIRLERMPNVFDMIRTAIPRCKDVGRLLGIEATVCTVKQVKLLEFIKLYECKVCRTIMHVEAKPSRNYAFPKSLDYCDNVCCTATSSVMISCQQNDLSSERYRFKDYQEILIMENFAHLQFGSHSTTMLVELEEDLVNSCIPGDSVLITGIVIPRYKPFRVNQRIESVLVLRANNVEVKTKIKHDWKDGKELLKRIESFWLSFGSNPITAHHKLLQSFCPEIHGMYIVKLCLAVAMCGGVHGERGKKKTRANSHILLLGDPGMAKSAFLKYIAKLCPRSVYTSGSGISAAGLTCSIHQNEGHWEVHGGALVFADNGICLIDEFLDIKKADLVCLLEPMEDQVISVAKAGIVCTLQTRCTIIATANPKPLNSNFDSHGSEMLTGLEGPMISRFDLIIPIKDPISPEYDTWLSALNLKLRNQSSDPKTEFDFELLQKYFLLVKEKNPVMGLEAQAIINKYYFMQRKSSNRDHMRTTVRLLEVLYRLAEGHARLMNRDVVVTHDAIMILVLVEVSMQSSSLTIIPNKLECMFPNNPVDHYRFLAKILLETLQLTEIWNSESTYLDTLL